ncbi:MAG TPA: efflux RND transporter periplasmic adaptor subunit [Kofleriaceae bacterium]|nr:efflux RND transporter periplasmic adaptor subunit [Kofleriaceae bacterium]
MRARILVLVLAAACSDRTRPGEATEHAEPGTHAGSDTAHGGAPHKEPELIKIAPDMMRDLRVTVGKAQARAAGETVSALGELHVNEDAYAEIASPVSARVAKVLARPGDTVSAGQALAQLTSPELGQSRAELDAARARLELARKTAERKRGLAADRLIPERERIEAEAALTEAEAAYNVASASLRKYGGGTAETSLVVRSPIAGTVIERSVVMGQLADPSRTLFRVGDLSTLWLVAHVFERDAVRVPIGSRAPASFAALPGKTFEAVIRAIGREVDAASRTIAIRLDVPNPDGLLRPGMSATVALPIGEPGGAPVIVVPAAAVQRVGASWAVFIPHREGTFEVRAIGRGRDLSGDVEVLSGLTAGEDLVIEGAFLLKAEADKARGGGHED